jgi:hypothetical protein
MATPIGNASGESLDASRFLRGLSAHWLTVIGINRAASSSLLSIWPLSAAISVSHHLRVRAHHHGKNVCAEILNHQSRQSPREGIIFCGEIIVCHRRMRSRRCRFDRRFGLLAVMLLYARGVIASRIRETESLGPIGSPVMRVAP